MQVPTIRSCVCVLQIELMSVPWERGLKQSTQDSAWFVMDQKGVRSFILPSTLQLLYGRPRLGRSAT
jgi:hypothetical protein